MSPPLATIKMALDKKTDNNKCYCVGENMEKLEPSSIAGRNVRWCSLFGNQESRMLSMPAA